jgi:hypothetical protein
MPIAQALPAPDVPKSHNTTRRILNFLAHVLQHITVTEEEALALLSDEAGTPPAMPTLRKYLRTLRCAGFLLKRSVSLQGEVRYRLTSNPFLSQSASSRYAQAIEELLVYLPKESTLYQKLLYFLPFDRLDAATGMTSPPEHYFMASIKTLPQYPLLQQVLDYIQSKQVCGVVLYQSSSLNDGSTKLWGMPYLYTPVGLRDAIVSFLHPTEKYLFHVKLSHIYRLVEPSQTADVYDTWYTLLPHATLKMKDELRGRYQLKPGERMDETNGTLHITGEFPFHLLRRLLKYGKLCTVESPQGLRNTHTTFTSLQQRIMEQARHSIT